MIIYQFPKLLRHPSDGAGRVKGCKSLPRISKNLGLPRSQNTTECTWLRVAISEAGVNLGKVERCIGFIMLPLTASLKQCADQFNKN